MDKEEKVLMRELIDTIKTDHDLLLLANKRSLDNEKSLSLNWTFTRKWLLRIGVVVLVIGSNIVPIEKLIKVAGI
jgi:hypothetical protein